MRRLLLAALLWALFALPAWATTRGDTFVDTVNTALESHTATGPSGGWTWTDLQSVAAAASINATNQLKANPTAVATYAAASVGSNDQYAQAQLMTASVSFPVCVRVSSTGVSDFSFYGARFTSGNWELWKAVSSSFTNLGSSAAALVAGDTVKIQVVGNAISVFINGTLTIGPITDASVASGTPGIQTRSDTIDPFIQNFLADVAGGGAVVAPMRTLLGVGQ